MRRALIASAALHLLAALLLWAGIGGTGRPLPEPAVVAVEVVSDPVEVAPEPEPTPPAPEPAETAPLPEREAAAPPPPPPPPPAPRDVATPEPAAEPPAPPEPAPEPAPAVAEAPPPEPEPAPPQAEPPPVPPPAPRPEPAVTEPEPPKAPDFVPRPRLRPKPPVEVAEAEPPAPTPPAPPAERPAPKPEAPAPKPGEKADVVKEDPLDALLRSVEEVAERRRAEQRREGRGRVDAADGGVARVEDGAARQAMLAALQRMVEDQIYRCWIVPIGAEGLRGAQVVLRFALAPDGSVQGMEVVDRERFARDPVFRTVAESAIRAVYRCAPLQLPGEQYALWREIEMNFDPARALGG